MTATLQFLADFRAAGVISKSPVSDENTSDSSAKPRVVGDLQIVDLEAYRPQPLPRASACVGGSVAITFGRGEEERELHFDLRQARALLVEIADAIAVAEHIERVTREAERG